MSRHDEYSHSSDAALIDAARAGDRDAYAELFLRHRSAALGYARKITTDDARAADLVSESFVKILDQLNQGAGAISLFRPYLFSTIRNLQVDQYRRERRELLVEGIGEDVSEALVGDDHAERQAETSTILSAFASLPETWQTVLWRTQVLGQSLDEVAQAIGSTVNTTGVTAFRAREGLRQAYLAQHMAAARTAACREVAHLIPRYVRGALGDRRATQVADHLRTCEHCQTAVTDVRQINTNLSGLLVPALVGLPGLSQAVAAPKAPVTTLAVKAVVGTALAGALVGSIALVVAAHDERSQAPTAAPSATFTVSRLPRRVLKPSSAPSENGSVRPTSSPPPSAPPHTMPTRATPSPQTSLPPPASPSAMSTDSPGEKPVSLAAPSVTVARSATAAVASVRTRVRGAERSEIIELLLEAENVRRASVDPRWACNQFRPSESAVSLSCSLVAPEGEEVFTVELEFADPGSRVAGQISLPRHAAVRSFAVESGDGPNPAT